MTPTLADKVNGPARLTKREVTVARLASEGHSSKAIALQLAVSVRTIDSHLAHAYRKLGVVGRQLVRRMHRRGCGDENGCGRDRDFVEVPHV